MAQQHFYIKAGDSRPYLRGTVKDANGAAVDIGAATVKFTMVAVGSRYKKVNKSTAVVTNGPLGLCEYRWNIASGDTDTPGDYLAEFEVTFTGDATIETFPNTKRNQLYVHVDKQGS